MEQTSGFRRYLQPAPTLKWHPWAPLLTVALMLLFAFAFGASWGWHASERRWQSMGHTYADRMHLDYLVEEKWPGSKMVSEAQSIDAVVSSFVQRQQTVPTTFERWRAAIEAFYFRAWSFQRPRNSAVNMAEFRLREFSAAHPRWQQTSSWCERYGRQLTEVDVRLAYQQAARDYSTLLGREVQASQLAPAVLGGKCPADPSRKF